MEALFAGITVLTLLMCVACAAEAHALDCPLPIAAKAGGAPLLSKLEIQSLGARLIGHETDNAVPEIASELRSKYPELANGRIVDVLVSGYCAALKGEGLEDAVARAKLRAFAKDTYDRVKG